MAHPAYPCREAPVATASEVNRTGDCCGAFASAVPAVCLFIAAMVGASAAIAQSSTEQNLASAGGALDFFRPRRTCSRSFIVTGPRQAAAPLPA